MTQPGLGAGVGVSVSVAVGVSVGALVAVAVGVGVCVSPSVHTYRQRQGEVSVGLLGAYSARLASEFWTRQSASASAAVVPCAPFDVTFRRSV
ncbi:MAG: hypothetical protein F4X02_09390 [Chloroflexi bacterium]|nr:hypothetical protein [Chloroflexota bacterium]